MNITEGNAGKELARLSESARNVYGQVKRLEMSQGYQYFFGLAEYFKMHKAEAAMYFSLSGRFARDDYAALRRVLPYPNVFLKNGKLRQERSELGILYNLRAPKIQNNTLSHETYDLLAAAIDNKGAIMVSHRNLFDGIESATSQWEFQWSDWQKNPELVSVALDQAYALHPYIVPSQSS